MAINGEPLLISMWKTSKLKTSLKKKKWSSRWLIDYHGSGLPPIITGRKNVAAKSITALSAPENDFVEHLFTTTRYIIIWCSLPISARSIARKTEIPKADEPPRGTGDCQSITIGSRRTDCHDDSGQRTRPINIWSWQPSRESSKPI